MFHLLKQAIFILEEKEERQKIIITKKNLYLVRIDNLVQVRVQHSLVGHVESITDLAQ